MEEEWERMLLRSVKMNEAIKLVPVRPSQNLVSGVQRDADGKYNKAGAEMVGHNHISCLFYYGETNQLYSVTVAGAFAVSAVNSCGCQPATASPRNEAVDDLTINLRSALHEDDLDLVTVTLRFRGSFIALVVA